MGSRAGRERWRRIRGFLVVLGLRPIEWFFHLLSWSGAQRAGRFLGRLSWPLVPGVRRRVLIHLSVAFPALEMAERKALARRVFSHLGTTLGELLYLSTRTCDHLVPHVRWEGWEIAEQHLRAKKPFFFLTGHCGNWELMAAAASCRGTPIFGFARATRDRRLQEPLIAFRSRFGSATIARGEKGSARKILRVLRHGEGVLGMLIDQDTRVEGVWVPFFGRPAFTPVGAAELALRQKLAVVPIFIEREHDGEHVARLQPPLDLPDDLEAATALMTRTIENQIRRCPEQWVWSHRRWRRQPETPPP